MAIRASTKDSKAGQDFLTEMVGERSARDPHFRALLAQAKARRARLRDLAALRADQGLSQTQVAARMGTSQAVVARIESGAVDTKLSTLERYAAALGKRLEWHVT